ncbi:metallophosphoesterase [Niastella vici]|uniref:metallophosphoesterase n=1 Tax=Niastella vici TaxID=1703345 RepID=UPI001C1FE172|nr:metallophosphoesterase [Niastella vici]
MRKFVIGDIHGCYDELIELTEKVGLTDNDMLISLGDIVDRGNKSKEVYDYFLNRPNSKVLMGNHERKHQNGILSYAQEIVKVQFGDEYEEFLKWLNSLEYYYETEEAIIIHAFYEHDKDLKAQRQDVLSGSTSGDRYLEKKYPEGKFWTEFYTGTKPIIYGHHVVGAYPKIINNTYGIDTGACHGDYLTAIELPGFIIHKVRAKRITGKKNKKIGKSRF